MELSPGTPMDAIRIIEADFNRSADTHLLRVPLPGASHIALYLKDESLIPPAVLSTGWRARCSSMGCATAGSVRAPPSSRLWDLIAPMLYQASCRSFRAAIPFLTVTGSRTFGQSTAGVADDAEVFDAMGLALGR